MSDESKEPRQDLECPFCGEGDFDLSGLKGHLQHEDCEEYREIKTEPRIRW